MRVIDLPFTMDTTSSWKGLTFIPAHLPTKDLVSSQDSESVVEAHTDP